MVDRESRWRPNPPHRRLLEPCTPLTHPSARAGVINGRGGEKQGQAMGRPTNPSRIALAVLAAAATPPLTYGILSFTPLPPTRLNAEGYVVATDGFDQIVHLVSVFDALPLGGVICLGVIALFAPLWRIHHRMGGGPTTFLLSAFLVGALPAGLVAWAAAAIASSLVNHPIDGSPIFVAAIATAGGVFAALLGVILWCAAYVGARPRTD